jgi:hypothetical protein
VKKYFITKLSLSEFEKVLDKNDDDGVCMLISIVKMIIARLVRGYFYLKKSIAMTII